MWVKELPANYKNIDLQVMTVNAAAQSVLLTPTASIITKAERVMLQAHVDNTGTIYIGKTGVLADGTTGAFQLPPGGVMWLLGKTYTQWFARASLAGQTLFVTYMSGVE